MENNDFTNIYISIDQNMVPVLFYFLEKGVRKEINVGSSIKTMLLNQFNVSADYVDNRIKTMFLDGRPVGDINSTIINDGATLALSAAMPGLAGATFRRLENPVPPQRKTEKTEENQKSKLQKGIIIIKLFNLVLRELGPGFLKSGVLISKGELAEFLLRQPEEFSKACKSVKINGHTAKIEALKQIKVADNSELIQLYVVPD